MNYCWSNAIKVDKLRPTAVCGRPLRVNRYFVWWFDECFHVIRLTALLRGARDHYSRPITLITHFPRSWVLGVESQSSGRATKRWTEENHFGDVESSGTRHWIRWHHRLHQVSHVVPYFSKITYRTRVVIERKLELSLERDSNVSGSLFLPHFLKLWVPGH